MRAWSRAFEHLRKDHRYYELVEDTLHEEFVYGYLVVKDVRGEPRAVQPFFVTDQDVAAGTQRWLRYLVRRIRSAWPGFLRMRTLMVGCAAGEGHLDASEDALRLWLGQTLASAIEGACRKLDVELLVFKEFAEGDRPALSGLLDRGFARIPSMPMTRLRLDFADFDDYLNKALSRNMRAQLRRKFRDAEKKASIEMRAVTDVTPYISDIYPLYLSVYERSGLRFEKLTPEFFSEIGRRMPDKAKFFLWYANQKLAAFNLCLIDEDEICSEYVGFDYPVALDLNLYYIVARDVLGWAISRRLKWYRSTSLNYEPKYRMRHDLEPLDLYVKHKSPCANFLLKRTLWFLGPVFHDKTLRRFQNYADIYA